MGGTKIYVKKIIGWESLLCCILFIGCLTSCHLSSDNMDKSQVEDLRILNEQKPLLITLDDIIDSISYIPLHSSECIIGEVDVVKRDGEFIFIKDKQKLSVFNSAGRFISNISSLGNGPKEYLYMLDFFLDKKNKHVYIVSYPDNKLLQYSYNGDFISTRELQKNANLSSVACWKYDSLIVYNALSNDINSRTAEYVLYADNSEEINTKKLLKGIESKSSSMYYPFLYEPMAFLGNRLFVISALSNIVYEYKDDSITESFRVNIPQLSPSTSFIKKNNDMDFFRLKEEIAKAGYGLGITGISSANGNLILSIGENRSIITDSKDGILIDSNIYDKNTNIYLSSLFTNGISEDHLGVYDPSFLLDIKDHIQSGENTRLKEIIKTLSDEDNPIVFQYHLKEDLITVLKSRYIK